MKKHTFNLGWRVKTGITQPFDAIFLGGVPAGDPVMLPQDAMIQEVRNPDCPSQNQAGYYPAKTYTYTKEFDVSADWMELENIVEFEGVMAKAMVYLNDEYVACHKYGYSSFFVDLKSYLHPGKNTLKVVAVNQELASRWYPGSGIYRNVNLWQGQKQHFVPEGMQVTTMEASDNHASVKVAYEMANAEKETKQVLIKLEILAGDRVVGEMRTGHQLDRQTAGCLELDLNGICLWSPDQPFLHTVRLIMTGEDGTVIDTHEEQVGIRHLSVSTQQGLCINGRTFKLRGACIHHDNGILGATELEAAAEFKLKNLRDAGFNSIRSAHNPASKALLAVCDRLGIMVMDELTDMWREQKNMNDFSMDFAATWQEETARMVRKDYNHACVVMYSTGNEIPEIGRTSGHDMHRQLTDLLHRLDGTRPVTNAISGFLAVASRAGENRAEQQAQYEQAQMDAQGSEQMNAIAGDIEKQMMDQFSVSPLLSECIAPIEAVSDVAGYNYLTARHEYIHTVQPDLVVVGSETYPTEIADLWRIVKENPHVIGDFTWTGYDYLGEAGIGVFHYDTDKKAQGWYPDRLAYCGDIDLAGYRRPVSYLREIAYGLRNAPYLFVRRADKVGHTHDKNRWKYHDGIHSWTFPGYEGAATLVYVLTQDPEAELLLNGVSLGTKKVGEQEGLTAIFEVPYQPGTLTVRTASGEDTLVTAGVPETLQVTASKTTLEKGGQDVCFITAELADVKGVINRFEPKKIEVLLEGDAVLAGYGSANPSCEGSYSDTVWETYDGRVMAAVRSTEKAGKAALTFLMDGKPAAVVGIDII